jgi:ribosomal protein S18 acetylase RimI-like enzyme
MREAAAWLDESYPERGVYLWVMENNVRAQRFYEHLGGRLAGAGRVPFADGTAAPNLRYAWDAPKSLLEAATPRSIRSRGRE